MTDGIPQWAKERACELANEERNSRPEYCSWNYEPRDFLRDFNCSPVLAQLARYIEKHEPAPVDPDLELAREAAAEYYRERGCHAMAECALAGHYDSDEDVQPALLAIRKLKERGK